MVIISIVCPVKNGSIYLNECIQSIINQSFKNWELIIVNDHSEDQTWDLLIEWSSKDSRIRPYQNKGNGIISALQMAANLIQGDYITRMDADDLMPNNKLDVLLDLIKSNKSGLATGKVAYIQNEYLKEGYKSYAHWLNQLCLNHSHYNEIYKECPIPSPGWLMRREEFEKMNGFNDLVYPEDYDFAFRCLKNDIPILCTSSLIHLWRDYPERTSRNDANYADNRFLNLKVERFLELSHNKDEKLWLWGAGKKGKKIAELLINKGIEFSWITNNPNKIGLNIYHHAIGSSNDLSNGQVIVSIASKKDQSEIKEKLIKSENLSSFWFC